jgi:hypothetical protein
MAPAASTAAIGRGSRGRSPEPEEATMAEDINRTPDKETETDKVDSVLELQQVEGEDPEVEAHGCLSGFSISAH